MRSYRGTSNNCIKMKRQNITTILLTLILLLFSLNGYCTKRKSRKEIKTMSHFGVYGGLGYSNLLHNIQNTNNVGGGTGMLGLQYFLSHPSHFNMHLGVEAMFFNSFTTLNDFTLNSKFYYNDPWNTNYEMYSNMEFDKYNEQHNILSVNIPLMFGAEFNKFYFAVGAKGKYSLWSYCLTHTDMTSTAIDPNLIEGIEGLPNHDIGKKHFKSQNPVKFGLDVTASAEIGIILDDWMSNRSTFYGKGRKRKPVHYRLGLFADYGILNQNTFNHSDMVVTFPNSAPNGTGGYIVPQKELGNMHNNSLLTTDISKSNPFNTFVVGVKFSVLFQVSKTPAPPKKKTRKKPTVRPVTVSQNETSKFVCNIKDADSGKPVDANISIFQLDGQKDTICYATADKHTGNFENNLNNKLRYGINISKDGYFIYKDTIENLSDTMFISLKPIKSNTTFIVQNLFFDVDKTTIKSSSAKALEEIFELLKDNPTINIIITGHTDNTASDAYNMRLSQGRAKSVYNEMVKRGIDPSRRKWQGKGMREPIDTNSTEEGRAKNRRVEITIQ